MSSTSHRTIQSGCSHHWRARCPKRQHSPHLFAAGYAACFEGTLREVARTRKLPLTDARITARVTLNITDDKRYVLGAEFRGNLVGISDEDARAHACGASDLPVLQLDARG